VKRFWIVVALLVASLQAQSGSQRWKDAMDIECYQHQPWVVGSNYIPASAIN
jgi:hypothetical protein